jgi:hypothetical protein
VLDYTATSVEGYNAQDSGCAVDECCSPDKVRESKPFRDVDEELEMEIRKQKTHHHIEIELTSSNSAAGRRFREEP